MHHDGQLHGKAMNQKHYLWLYPASVVVLCVLKETAPFVKVRTAIEHCCRLWFCTDITVSPPLPHGSSQRQAKKYSVLSLSLCSAETKNTNKRLGTHNFGVSKVGLALARKPCCSLPPMSSHETLVCLFSFWQQASPSRKRLSQSQGKRIRKQKVNNQLLSRNHPASPSRSKAYLACQPVGSDVVCALNTSDQPKIERKKKDKVPKVVMIRTMRDERRTINNETILSSRQPRNMVAISQHASWSQQGGLDPSQKEKCDLWDVIEHKLHMFKQQQSS